MLLTLIGPVGKISMVPVVPLAVYTVRNSVRAGRAAAGNTANSRLVPPGWCSDPDRYTTPPLTAQDGLPEFHLACSDRQPLSSRSACQVTPLTAAADRRASPRTVAGPAGATCAAFALACRAAADAGVPPNAAVSAASTVAMAADPAAADRTGRKATVFTGPGCRCGRPRRPRKGRRAATSARAWSFARVLVMVSP